MGNFYKESISEDQLGYLYTKGGFMAKKVSMGDRLYVKKDKESKFRKRLKQLTDASKLDPLFGELFLNEIRLSKDEANKHLRDRAKILGLM